MAYGLFELATRRSAGSKPSMVIVRFSSQLPKSEWWRFSDTAPEIVIRPADRISVDDLVPFSGLDLLMFAETVTDQVESVFRAAQQVANCITFVSESVDGGGFCWHHKYGEKLLGDRYEMAA